VWQLVFEDGGEPVHGGDEDDVGNRSLAGATAAISISIAVIVERKIIPTV
jgi:hypothetical protein